MCHKWIEFDVEEQEYVMLLYAHTNTYTIYNTYYTVLVQNLLLNVFVIYTLIL